MKKINEYISNEKVSSLDEYIIEKLKINKLSSDKGGTDMIPFEDWNIGDIIWFYGFRIEFYKIIKKTSKYFWANQIKTKVTSGAYNAVKYTCIPSDDPKDIDSEVIKGFVKDKNYVKIDGRNGLASVWNGEEVEGNGVF